MWSCRVSFLVLSCLLVASVLATRQKIKGKGGKQTRWGTKTSKLSDDADPNCKVPGTGYQCAGLVLRTWNVFRFGPSKFDAAANLPIIKDYDCSRKKVLAEQIRDADILALQEYFDSAQTYDVMNELIDEVERQTLEATGKNITWDFKCGKAGGHETAKEQACYLWRTDVAKLTQSATYEEKAGQNIFSRQPFYAEFAINKKGFSIPKIVLGTIHTEPSNADKEIAALASVTKDIAKLFKNPNAMVFGDYNGDCQYLRNSARLANGMFLDPDYDCLINNELDSASMTTDCTFDRAFVMGTAFQQSFVDGSARAEDFVEKHNITPGKARLYSDHFPVSMCFVTPPAGSPVKPRRKCLE